MNKNIRFALCVGLLSLGTGLTGCTKVVSSMPTTTVVSGDSWYSTVKMFKGKVYYCPAPASGQATCIEAKMVPASKK